MRSTWQRRMATCCLFALFFLTVHLAVEPAIGACLSPLQAAAEQAPAPTSTQVGAAYLCCLDTNAVLYQKNAQEVIYPAASVKIMAGLLACRLLQERVDDTVTLTSSMLAGVAGRSLHLAEGETVTVRDLLYAALCGSYNDATTALAVICAGSVPAFVEQMNREASRLGADKTNYTNPTGLHDSAMMTTAADTALVAREAYGHPLYMEITSTNQYTIPATQLSEARTIYNRNLLLSDTSQNYRNGYCRGMNAGMTDEGGWSVITVCERGGVALLSVVMQGTDVATGQMIPAYTYTNALLSWARTSFGYRQVLSKGQTMDTLPVAMTGISSSRAKVVTSEALSVYLPLEVNPETDLSISYVLDQGRLSAPLKAGERVGLVTVKYAGDVVGTVTLCVENDYAVNDFLTAMMGFRAYLTSRPFFASLGIFALLMFIYLRLWYRPAHRFGTRHTKKRPRRK